MFIFSIYHTPYRGAHAFSKTYVYTIGKKKKTKFRALPLYQPSKYITYYKVPIAFPLASYLQTGKPIGVLSPWQAGQLSRRQADDVFAKVTLETIRTKWKACHKTGLLPSTLAAKFTENHLKPQRFNSGNTKSIESEMLFANIPAKLSKKKRKFITRLKHHLLNWIGELWSIIENCPS